MNKFSWSYSAYSTALVCLQKFKLLYIDKIKSEEESGDLVFGSALHLGINAILEKGDGAMVFGVYWDSYQDKDIKYGRFNWKQLKVLGEGFLRKFEKMHAPKLVPHIMEQRLYSDYKGLKLEGTLDYSGTYEGIPSVLDWKTTGYAYDPRKPTVALQLYLYSYLAIKELNYVPEKIGYYPFVKATGSIQGPLLIEFDHDHMFSMLDNMLDYAEMLDKNKNYPKNVNSCIQGAMVCPMFERCHGSKGEKA
jgi:hypothetical protein